eukprot:3463842-Rhodomonas_salina.5
MTAPLPRSSRLLLLASRCGAHQSSSSPPKCAGPEREKVEKDRDGKGGTEKEEGWRERKRGGRECQCCTAR